MPNRTIDVIITLCSCQKTKEKYSTTNVENFDRKLSRKLNFSLNWRDDSVFKFSGFQVHMEFSTVFKDFF